MQSFFSGVEDVSCNQRVAYTLSRFHLPRDPVVFVARDDLLLHQFVRVLVRTMLDDSVRRCLIDPRQ